MNRKGEFYNDYSKKLLDKIISNSSRKDINIPFYEYSKLNTVLPGLERGQIIAFTANSGVGKTNLLRNLILDLLISSIKKDMKLKFVYFMLEESVEFFDYACISILASKHYNMSISTKELIGIEKLSEDKIEFFKSSSILRVYSMLRKNIYFVTDIYDPIRIISTYIRIANKYGKFFFRGRQASDDLIQELYIDKFVADDEHSNTFIVPVIDHLNMLMRRGESLRNLIEEMVMSVHRYVVKTCNMPAILIHQQAMATEDAAYKNTTGNRPSMQGLGDAKTVARYYSYLLGIWDPSRYGITSYGQYDITTLNRIIIPLKIRDGIPAEVVLSFKDASKAIIEI